jgi:hypothetical protein
MVLGLGSVMDLATQLGLEYYLATDLDLVMVSVPVYYLVKGLELVNDLVLVLVSQYQYPPRNHN